MQFLRLVAGPIAAGLLLLAPASMPAFAQEAPVQAPATEEDLAYRATFSTATTDVTALWAQREGIDARIVTADANTDYALLVSDLMTLSGQWQGVTEKIVVLQPTPRYVAGNTNMAIATQTFSEGYKALANSFGTNDPALLLGAMQAITAAGGMLNAAGLELQAA